LEAFAQRVGDGLREADWETRRAILRALIKQVEVGKEAIRVVYKVNPSPFDQGPGRGRSQDCWRGDQPAIVQCLPERTGQVRRGHADPDVHEGQTPDGQPGVCAPSHTDRGRTKTARPGRGQASETRTSQADGRGPA